MVKMTMMRVVPRGTNVGVDRNVAHPLDKGTAPWDPGSSHRPCYPGLLLVNGRLFRGLLLPCDNNYPSWWAQAWNIQRICFGLLLVFSFKPKVGVE